MGSELVYSPFVFDAVTSPMPDVLSEASHVFPALIQVRATVRLKQLYSSGKEFGPC